jgi:hypothetical protein
LVLTSALASQIKRDGSFMTCRGFRPCWLRIWHLFFHPTFGRSWVVYRCATFWIYEIPLAIGYYSCRSQQELPEYTKITPHYPENVPLLWGQKSCFFSFAPKRHLSQSKVETIHMCKYYSSKAIRITIIWPYMTFRS